MLFQMVMERNVFERTELLAQNKDEKKDDMSQISK